MPHLIDIISKKLDAGDRLSEADALALFESPELPAIGALADHVNRAKNRDIVFYNVNRHINPTNICALSCKFCAYSRKPGEEGGYAYSIEEMVAKAGEAVQSGATEVHMVGGLHPRWKYEHYRDMIAAIKQAYPDLHLKAFTAVELDWLARKSRKSIQQVLEEMQAAGLGSLPGGGAEIFDPEIRDAICDTKVSAEQWLDTHRIAHTMGMRSNCTMLYGHIERYPHRVDHMRRLRELQDVTHGFNAFIPLAFQPFQNEMGIDRYTFGYDDLKTIAIARLFLDNFRHIKAYWVMLGQDVAQLALQFGANDLDGTVVEEKISRMAGGRAGMSMSRPFLESLIRKAARIPCERDTLYNPVQTPEAMVRPAAATPVGDDKVAQLVHLARHANLHELARLSGQQDVTSSASCEPNIVVGFADAVAEEDVIQRITTAMQVARSEHRLLPSTITLDLAIPASTPSVAQAPTETIALSQIDLPTLVQMVTTLRRSFPRVKLAIAGLKSLWRLSQHAQMPITEVLEQLAEAGIDQIEGSAAESEADLTHREASDLHQRIHASEIKSIARVELTAPSHWTAGRETGAVASANSDEPMWESFVRRALTFAELHAKTQGIIGLSVEVSPGSFVSPSEYLRAIAIARLAAPAIPYLIAPLALVPSLSPSKGLGSSQQQLPAEKFAALALHYGANDLGPINLQRLNPLAIMQQIRASGFAPALRGASVDETTKESALVHELDAIRHRPALSSAL